jgi:hypothetical protein
MRLIAILFCLLCILAQGGLTYLWQDPSFLQLYKETFHAFYPNGIPAWSEWAFSFGRHWYLISSLLFGCWIIAVLPFKTPYALRLTALSAILALIAMLYAMYPLHLMPALGGAI